jgi:membrane-bound serine protease (ClpP class)
MRGLRVIVRATAALAVVLGSVGLAAEALGAEAPAPVLVGHIEGVINPVTAQYVNRVVAEGEASRAAAVVFVINTPGGLIESTYTITGRFLSAKVPIVTFVAPTGARAASAGAFITLAGNIAAMGPATNIGAAHPAPQGGERRRGPHRQHREGARPE